MFGHEINPGQIILKDENVLRGLMERSFSPLLIDIICAVAVNFGIVMTESWREKKHKNDLHGMIPVRADDLRSWCYIPENKCYKIMDWINKKWEYDYKRPDMTVAMIHNSGQGIHFHVQVHPNTRRRLS